MLSHELVENIYYAKSRSENNEVGKLADGI